MLEKMFEKLDQYPVGSKERTDGVGTTIYVRHEPGEYNIVLKEPALLYMEGGVMGLGPNTGKSGGGYRLEIYRFGSEIILVHNSPTKEGVIDYIEKKLKTARVLQELV